MHYCICKDLKISIQDGCRLTFSLTDGNYDFPLAALGLLDKFTHPRTFTEAARQISATGSSDWIHQTAILRSLIEIGALDTVEDGKQPPKAVIEYGSARIHIDMLNDKARTRAYQKAIRDLVKPGDCVVDIGTGTGVLAMTAIQAGAAKVYALEANPATADIARHCIRQNGFSDGIEVVQGWSTSVELPERADLIVSEMFGNDPFDEDILSIYADAVKRFAKPGAKLIPQGFDLCCAPLFLTQEQLDAYVPGPDMLAEWQREYQLDFSVLAGLEYTEDRPLFYAKPQRLASTVAGEMLCLGHVDLTSSQPINPGFRLSLKNRQGCFNALMLYFDTFLSPGNRLSLAPGVAEQNNHWRTPVWYLQETLDLAMNSGFRLYFERTNTGKNRLFIR